MDLPKDRRTLFVLAGAAVALLAGLLIAWSIHAANRADTAPSPASEGGLVIESAPDDGKIDPARPLRCFVAGQFAGEFTLAECAKRNGVATGALDVGVDETGALAAAEQAGTMLTPLPPPAEAPVEAPKEAAPLYPPTPADADAGPVGACWRYADNQWRKLPTELGLNACVQTLFAGRCERPGSASYGRWMQQTLRLAPGRVEISGDNKSFKPIAEQGAGCSIAPVG